MARVAWYSVSPFGTGDISNGSPTITIDSNGLATISVGQTGNIGAGCCIDFAVGNTLVYIAPACRPFTSGGTYEIKVGDKLTGATSSATAWVRQIEVTSGTWAGGDAAGNIYIESKEGTFQSENLDVRSNSNVATIAGDFLGNMSTTFQVRTALGQLPSSVGSAETINSIHHEYSSLSGFESGHTDANHLNDTDYTNADILPAACLYYDHDDGTLDTTAVTISGNTDDATRYFYLFSPRGELESVNNQFSTDGVFDTSKYVLSVNAVWCLNISQAFTRYDGIQCEISDTASIASCIRFQNIASSDMRGINSICRQSADNGSSTMLYYFGPNSDVTGGEFRLANAIGYDSADNGIFCRQNFNNLYAYYCTMVDNDRGFDVNSGTVTSKNSVATFNSVNDFEGSIGGTNNCSEDGTGPSTNKVDTDQAGTALYADYNNDDFGPLDTDSDLYENGTDLSSDTDYPIYRDITGLEITGTPDIGAIQYVPGVVSTGNPWYYYAQMACFLMLLSESYELAIKFLENIEV